MFILKVVLYSTLKTDSTIYYRRFYRLSENEDAKKKKEKKNQLNVDACNLNGSSTRTCLKTHLFFGVLWLCLSPLPPEINHNTQLNHPSGTGIDVLISPPHRLSSHRHCAPQCFATQTHCTGQRGENITFRNIGSCLSATVWWSDGSAPCIIILGKQLDWGSTPSRFRSRLVN